MTKGLAMRSLAVPVALILAALPAAAQERVDERRPAVADGSVAKAEVVGTSGRQDLDQAVAQWITGHWTYRPAIRDGAPATAQVLAAVNFNLADAQ